MEVGQGGEGGGGVEVEGGGGFGGEVGGAEDGAVVGEADQAVVEGGVPEGGEEQAVVDVQAQGVGFAFGPGDDVRGAQERRIRDAGQRTATVPVFQQSLAEQSLSDTLDGESLNFGCLRQMCGGLLERVQGRIRKAHAQFVDAL